MLFQTTQTLVSYSLFAPDFLLRSYNNGGVAYMTVISVTGVLFARTFEEHIMRLNSLSFATCAYLARYVNFELIALHATFF
jgi:hypothetical protein